MESIKNRLENYLWAVVPFDGWKFSVATKEDLAETKSTEAESMGEDELLIHAYYDGPLRVATPTGLGMLAYCSTVKIPALIEAEKRHEFADVCRALVSEIIPIMKSVDEALKHFKDANGNHEE